jgi:16S rRNA (guanine966-N2)-methyltransferase
MRVIAGALKGRTLQTPAWEGLRPTSDKLRETLFNVLAPRIEGARVLDGYAGTGAIGIEALSRGASHVTFVERDPRAVRLIAENLRRCGVADRYAIIRAELNKTRRRRPDRGEAAYDVIILDPPYGVTELMQALVAAEALMSTSTLLVIEHAKRDVAPARSGRLVLTRSLTSGDSALAFYTVAESSASVEPPS